jgi:hypothetical protein
LLARACARRESGFHAGPFIRRLLVDETPAGGPRRCLCKGVVQGTLAGCYEEVGEQSSLTSSSAGRQNELDTQGRSGPISLLDAPQLILFQGALSCPYRHVGDASSTDKRKGERSILRPRSEGTLAEPLRRLGDVTPILVFRLPRLPLRGPYVVRSRPRFGISKPERWQTNTLTFEGSTHHTARKD